MAKGFDNLPINHQLAMSLPFTEYTGVAGAYTYDRSINHFMFELHGPPTWAIPGAPASIRCLNFAPGNPDWLDCGAVATAALDYTSEDFSIVAWINPHDLTANRTVLCRGFLDADGYYLQILINGQAFFITNQAAAHQNTISTAGDFVVDTWQLVGMSRSGDSVTLFKNGMPLVLDTVGVHTDPASANREMHIGIYDNETGSPWSQYMWDPRVWGDRALTQYAHRYIFEVERHWFNV